MVELLNAPKHIAAFKVTQVLDSEDYEDIFDQIEFKLSKHFRVPIYVDLLGLNHVTAQAVAKRVAYSMAKIGEWHRFPRIAIISEKTWISTMAKICSALIPRVEMRTFSSHEKEMALKWVDGVDAENHSSAW